MVRINKDDFLSFPAPWIGTILYGRVLEIVRDDDETKETWVIGKFDLTTEELILSNQTKTQKLNIGVKVKAGKHRCGIIRDVLIRFPNGPFLIEISDKLCRARALMEEFSH
jgi:hypothetical protein